MPHSWNPNQICGLNKALTTAPNFSQCRLNNGSLRWLALKIRKLALLAHFHRRRKHQEWISKAVLPLVDDDVLVDAFKFLTRLELCVAQLVCRRLQQVVESDAIAVRGPCHRLQRVIISQIEAVWNLEGCTWGSGVTDNVEKPPAVTGLSFKDRLLLRPCMKRVPFLRGQVKKAQCNYVRRREKCREWWRKKVYDRYKDTYMFTERVMPTSAFELRIEDAKLQRLLPCLQVLEGVWEGTTCSLLLSDACKYPLPRYVRVKALDFSKMPCPRSFFGSESNRPLPKDLCLWLYHSREAFTKAKLHLTVDNDCYAPWLLDHVFTRPSSLETGKFYCRKPPPSLLYCNTIHIWYGVYFNFDWIFEWLHCRNTNYAHGECSTNGIGDMGNPKHLILVHNGVGRMADGTMMNEKLYDTEKLLARVKEVFLEDRHITPAFLISFDITNPAISIWDPFELLNEATAEKLVMRAVYENEDVGHDRQVIYKLYRCQEEAEGSMLTLLEHKAHKSRYQVWVSVGIY